MHNRFTLHIFCTAKNSQSNNGNLFTTETAEAFSSASREQFTAIDERITKTETGYLGNVDPAIPNTQMAGRKVDNEGILNTPLIVQSTLWSTGQTPGTILTQLSIPQLFNETENIHQTIMELYAFAKFKLDLEIRVNTTKFHLGKLIACWDPMDMSTSPGRPMNQYRATGLPNVIIEAGDSNTGILKIPWEHILSFLNTADTTQETIKQFGTVYVLVLNRLSAIDTVTQQVGVNLILSAPQARLRIPMRRHALQFEPVFNQGDDSIDRMTAMINRRNADQSALTGSPSAPSMEQSPPTQNSNNDNKKNSGIVSGIAKIGANVGGAIWNIFTGNWSGLSHNVSEGFGGVTEILKGLSLDKPAGPVNKTINLLSSASPLAHIEGVDGSVRLGATPMGGYLSTEFTQAPDSEKSISNIIQTKMLVDQISWQVGQVSSTVLATYSVRPGLYASNATKDANNLVTETPTFLSYMEKLFRQWRGGIEFRFDFTASQFHSGRVQISFEPAVNVDSLSTQPDVLNFSQNPNLIFDLREHKTVSVKVPFISGTPRKYTSLADEESLTQPIAKVLMYY